MTVVVKCQTCASVLLVIDEKTIDKPMYTIIGKMAGAGPGKKAGPSNQSAGCWNPS
jgi:hypothetical protein